MNPLVLPGNHVAKYLFVESSDQRIVRGDTFVDGCDLKVIQQSIYY